MKLCLIGSTRFKELYFQANRELTAKGHIVYTVAFVTSAAEPTPVSDEEKEILDLVHLRKIMESDGVVLITDESNYVGDSTRRELIWAQMLEKSLYMYPHGFSIYSSIDSVSELITHLTPFGPAEG